MRITPFKKIAILLFITIGYAYLLPYQAKGQAVEGPATVWPERPLLTGVVPEGLVDSFNFIIVNGPDVTVQGKEGMLLRLFEAAVEWLTDEITLVGGKSRIAVKNSSNIPLEIDFVCKELGLPRLRVRLMPDSIADIPISVDPETVPYFEAATIRLVVPNFKTEHQTSLLLHKRILFSRNSVK